MRRFGSHKGESAGVPDRLRQIMILYLETFEFRVSNVTRAEPSIVRNGPAAEALCFPEAETK